MNLFVYSCTRVLLPYYYVIHPSWSTKTDQILERAFSEPYPRHWGLGVVDPIERPLWPPGNLNERGVSP